MNDQRDKILASACELYLESGLDGFSMRKLAGHVGVTAPALYRYYDGKEAVLADVVREAFRAFTRYVYRSLAAPTPAERFLGAGEGYLDFVIDHPRWHTILNTGPEGLGMESFPDDIEAMGCAVHQFWIDRVRECMDAGILKPGDPAEVSVTMWAHAYGMVQLYHQGQLRMEPEDFRSFFTESGTRLMAGIATTEFGEELLARFEASAGPAAASADGR